jgi:hypothetical protein
MTKYQSTNSEFNSFTLSNNKNWGNQEQSEVPEERCGFEMLAGDVSLGPHSPDTLSKAIKENRSAVCWRQTADEQNRCDWHAEKVASADNETVGNASLIVLDGANVDELDARSSLNGITCRYADLSDSDFVNAKFLKQILNVLAFHYQI